MMTEYTEKVQRHGILLAAKEWAMECKAIHVHSLDSMWYETPATKKHTANGKMVTDTELNCGIIHRNQDGKRIHTFGEMPDDETLLDMFGKNAVN